MRRRAWAWLALSSVLWAPAGAATRPRYGGTLVLDWSGAWASLDAADSPAVFVPEIMETLVRLNAKGDVEPLLAVNWQHDADRRRWRFSLRPRVVFHDGQALNAASAMPSLLASLRKKYDDVNVTAGGQTVVIQSERAMPDLLAELARPRHAVFRRSEKNIPIGTGPFRVNAWEPGRKLTLGEFEDYWGGRPFLDAVVINIGPVRERADVMDVPFGTTRRVLPEGMRIWTSAPRELVALLAVDVPLPVKQALSLAIDRTPLVNVLAQKRGEAAFGLLPQWLSGYAFLFATMPDVARAKELTAPMHLSTLTMAYPANDPFSRSIADRVALNARDAGIAIQLVQNPAASLRLVRLPLESADSNSELTRLASVMGLTNGSKFDSLLETEKSLLENSRAIPLLYLPEVFGLSARVHNWEVSRQRSPFVMRLEDVWIDP